MLFQIPIYQNKVKQGVCFYSAISDFYRLMQIRNSRIKTNTLGSFNKIEKHICIAWVFFSKLAAYFQNSFVEKNTWLRMLSDILLFDHWSFHYLTVLFISSLWITFYWKSTLLEAPVEAEVFFKKFVHQIMFHSFYLVLLLTFYFWQCWKVDWKIYVFR